jgi:serine/threonine protein kinase
VPPSIEQALDIGVQRAAGIEAAHDQGVVHRDLEPTSTNPSLSPTMTSLGTIAGVILGTAAYMSPEQARGQPLDRRTDLWSFGCVLFDCLTGKTLFEGETVSDSLAAVLRKDLDWKALPAMRPVRVTRCRVCSVPTPRKRCGHS